ncbi:peptidoglycan-binding protein [Scytonema sp. UIC 10036]|nr:peptidoglycan-binding protein [Scytonema sp. UIC 10036]
MPTLRKGSKTEGVRFLQQLLINHYNYDLVFDAIFGSKTENAVKDFQTKHKLTQDGVVGVNTWRALGANIGN